MSGDLISIIIDFGSFKLRIGSHNSINPDFIYPSFVGKIKGNDLYSDKPKISYHPPITRTGIDSYVFEDLLDDAIKAELKHLQVRAKDCSVICTFPFRYAGDNDEDISRGIKLKNAMYEQANVVKKLLNDKYKFNKIFVLSDAELSMKTQKLETGIVMQIGYQVTTILAIIKNEIKGRETVNLGGYDIIKYLENEMKSEGIDINTPSGLRDADKFIQENCIAVTGTIDGELFPEMNDITNENRDDLDSPPPIQFEFKRKDLAVAKRYSRMSSPTPSSDVKNTKYSEAIDILFQPPGEKYIPGIADHVYKVIMQVEDIEYHPLLYANIIISGGVSNIPGLKEKLKANIYKFAPKGAEIIIKNSNEDMKENGLEMDKSKVQPDLAAFIGGCNLANDEDDHFCTLQNQIREDNFVRMRSFRSYQPLSPNRYSNLM